MSLSDSVSRQDFVLPQPAIDPGVDPRPAIDRDADPRPTIDRGIDPRGPRFSAGVTAAVLAAVLVLPSPAAAALLAAQVLVFAVGAVRGVQHTPYAWLFRTTVRPRLAPPGELEDPAPPRFAQSVGLGFALVGLLAFLAGATVLAQAAVGLALTAALLNALFRFCLGCEVFLLARQFAFH